MDDDPAEHGQEAAGGEPARRARRWPALVIVAGVVLSVVWSGLVLWALAGALGWLVR